MSRRGFNWQIVTGLGLSLAGFLSYPLLFERWPVTRDVPWANLVLFTVAGALLAGGVRRAAGATRFRIAKVIVSGLMAAAGAAVCGYFLYVAFVLARQVPPSANAPQVGQRAPDFTLPDQNGQRVSLAGLLTEPAGSSAPSGRGAAKGVLLIFYMYSGCRACNSEFRGVQQTLAQFEALGVRPVAISIDPPNVSRRLSEEANYTFTFLSDPAMDVIRRYDVADQHEGARPAEFLIDSAGVVRWRYLTDSIFVRARSAQMLDAARLLTR